MRMRIRSVLVIALTALLLGAMFSGIAFAAEGEAAEAADRPAAAAAQTAAAWARHLPRPDGCAQAVPQPGSGSVSHSEGV